MEVLLAAAQDAGCLLHDGCDCDCSCDNDDGRVCPDGDDPVCWDKD